MKNTDSKFLKPKFLHRKLYFNKDNQAFRNALKSTMTNTVCYEARCPNMSECFHKGTATFMILGKECSRSCKFCSVKSAAVRRRIPPPDINEPVNIANLIYKLNIKFAVITSVARDDLPDEGALHFNETIHQIKLKNPGIKCEVLIPDFNKRVDLIKLVIDSGIEVLNHNLETIRRLTSKIRSKSDYDRSLSVLQISKQINKNLITKTGIMLGFDERMDELEQTFKDIASVNCDILTVGQYLQPSFRHIKVEKYYKLEEYEYIRNIALKSGIKIVHAGPFVRSSYKSHESYNDAKKLQV